MTPFTDPSVTAVALTGLLAEPARLRVVAAIVLGASTIPEMRAATGLGTREVAVAVERLTAGGLVVRDGAGHHFVVEGAFGAAARAAAPAPTDVPEDGDAAAAKVLRAFVRDGRLLAIPTARGKRRLLLDLLAQDFEPGQQYPEREVNQILRRWHDDTAALRRYLVDDGYLSRANGQYWRSGGSFSPD